MKIVSVVGARPQFIKLFPFCRNLPSQIEHAIIHTGQHYDASLSQIFFDELGIPRPSFNLGIGSASHAIQTAEIMIALEPKLIDMSPDVVVVFGDTNSTLAASLVAAKTNVPLIHIESGLRSFNRHMPEELNRVVVDHLSNLLLAPTEIAMRNLATEGLERKSVYVGDIMVDSLLMAKDLMLKSQLSLNFNMPDEFILCTVHRDENTATFDRVKQILLKLSESPIQVLFVAHPRFNQKCLDFGINQRDFNIQFIAPQSYLTMVYLLEKSAGVITDSGGLQKDAYLLQKRVITLRRETEWLETLDEGWNRLDFDLEITNQDWHLMPVGPHKEIFGSEGSSFRIIEEIQKFYLETK
jgi:UDP-N-acetylglucosamine 2-epimerase (non-hydrolysing)